VSGVRGPVQKEGSRGINTSWTIIVTSAQGSLGDEIQGLGQEHLSEVGLAGCQIYGKFLVIPDQCPKLPAKFNIH
jgi:hypothetical protein